VTELGAVYAKIDNAHTRRTLHLFGTHLHYGTDDRKYREEQLDALGAFIAEKVDPDDETADVLVLGDLNIRGIPLSTDGEWLDLINGGPLADNRLSDTWLRQSPDDPQPTTDGPENTADPLGSAHRLDYVLLRSAFVKNDRTTCAMHAQVQHGFEALSEDGQLRDLSDHFPLLVTLGTDVDRCSPIEADLIDGPALGEIVAPGNLEWFRVDEGTWSFETVSSTPEPLRITLYAVDQISEALVPVGSQTSTVDGRVTVPVFDSLGAMYVRIEDPAGGVGPYELLAHENTGATFDDPLFLQAGEEVIEPGLEAGHFRLRQEALDSGEKQRLELRARCTAGEPQFSLFDRELDLLLSEGPDGLCDGLDCLTIGPSNSPISAAAQDLFLQIACDPGEELLFARYDIDQFTVRFDELHTSEEGDFLDLGSEELKLEIEVDGGDPIVIYEGALEEGEGTGTLLSGLTVRFADKLKFTLTEKDLAGSDETFEATYDADNLSLSPGSIDDKVQLQVPNAGAGADGAYLLRFDRSYGD
jgi:hypothetical protein